VRVDASADGGASWADAQITYVRGRWSWVLWAAELELAGGAGGEVWCRAADASGGVQLPECDWNLRGVAYSGYGRAPIPEAA
jgi:sulfite oxidase